MPLGAHRESLTSLTDGAERAIPGFGRSTDLAIRGNTAWVFFSGRSALVPVALPPAAAVPPP